MPKNTQQQQQKRTIINSLYQPHAVHRQDTQTNKKIKNAKQLQRLAWRRSHNACPTDRRQHNSSISSYRVVVHMKESHLRLKLLPLRQQPPFLRQLPLSLLPLRHSQHHQQPRCRQTKNKKKVSSPSVSIALPPRLCTGEDVIG